MYNRPRIIPTLLLKDQGLVKTINFKKERYLGDPINAVKIFNEKEVDELCLLDITASKMKKEPDYELLKKIASEAFMPLSYGGGITRVDEIKKILSIGYEKVIINTCFFKNPRLIKEAVQIFGSQSILVAIDIKKAFWGREYCYIENGKRRINKDFMQSIKRAENFGAGEILLNCIENDGKMKGYDIELIKKVSKLVNIPVIPCGGAGSMNDIKKVIDETETNVVSAGSLFVYFGKKKAVLINFPSENEFIKVGIFKDE